MDKHIYRESKFDKFKKARPEPIDVSEISLIKSSYLGSETQLPLVIEPAISGVDLVDWARGNKDFLETELLKHGAILFRGFQTSIRIFEEFASVTTPNLIPNYGDLPLEENKEKVYQSTPYPSDETIKFHNESSHFRTWPRKQFFMCVRPSREGGATAIVDCRKIYQRLAPSIREKFQEKQLLYVRNYTPKLDVSWQTFFHTEDRTVVEDRCRADGCEFEWKGNDTLKTRTRALGVVKHPKSGEMSFFNQIQLHHVSCLPDEYRESVLSMLLETDLPRNVYYGDGSPIEDHEVAETRKVYEELAVDLFWEAGDLLMLDNMLVAHARRPYVGDRKLVVALGEMTSIADIGLETATI